MRYGVLADIHGNLHALRAALSALGREGVDRYLIAGDLVGYGPNPNECVELVAGLDAVCVAGNHDLIALDRLSDERCPELARRSLRWTRTVLTDETRAFLASLPLRATAPGGIVMAHGSLDDPQEYTRRPQQAVPQLTSLSQDGGGRAHSPPRAYPPPVGICLELRGDVDPQADLRSRRRPGPAQSRRGRTVTFVGAASASSIPDARPRARAGHLLRHPVRAGPMPRGAQARGALSALLPHPTVAARKSTASSAQSDALDPGALGAGRPD